MSASTNAIIVTAADDQYLSLVQDLLSSLRDTKFDVVFDIGILDVGLSETSLKILAAYNVCIEKVKSDIDFPARAAWEAAKPGFRTLTARLFMRDYFPGYDVYMWADADIWVQTPEAINTMIVAAAKSPAIHICCELDRCYSTFFQHAAIWHIYRDWYQSNFDEPTAAAMTLKPMLNAGTWAMSKDSPVWDAWVQIYTEALHRLPEATDKSFMADQLGLNILLYLKKLPHVILPASFNWMTSYALPMLNSETRLYVEPSPPHRPISQFHLTRPIKIQVEKIQCTDGQVIDRSLAYGARG